ncbi:atp-dependent protease [Qipengyuania citrea LAMA 915]|uniref:Atp-dependent protease n=1 Tax=Qipengyuania citrea LAMA 915 TaxID=1306953 RepID=A0A0L1KIB3_9SPHN|nr:atp-dependent protease [Qipengyuania citrea LAMA 915]
MGANPATAGVTLAALQKPVKSPHIFRSAVCVAEPSDAR